jgi:hypothetical protein
MGKRKKKKIKSATVVSLEIEKDETECVRWGRH